MQNWLSWSFWVHSAPGALHFVLALACLALGAYVLFSPKGNTRHRLLGSTWLILMITVNTSALTMYGVSGRPNLFHGFAVLSLATIIPGYISIRRYAQSGELKHLAAHSIWMRWGYFGLAAAGVWQLASRALLLAAGPGYFWTGIYVLIALTIAASMMLNRWMQRQVVEVA